MRKRFALFIVLFSIMISGVVFAQEISIIVNGAKISDTGTIVGERTLVPIRGIADALGADTYWDSNTKTVTLSKPVVDIYPSGDSSAEIRKVSLTIGDKNIKINGINTFELDVPAQIINNKTMIPVRDVSECFGANVDWDSDTKTVSIKTALNNSYSEAQLDNALIKKAEMDAINSFTSQPIDFVVYISERQIPDNIAFVYGDTARRKNKEVGLYYYSFNTSSYVELLYSLDGYDESISGIQTVNGIRIENREDGVYLCQQDLAKFNIIKNY